MSSDIKVILFDADGVIQKSTKDFISTLEIFAEASKKRTNHFTKLYKVVGVKTPTAKSFIKDIFAAEQPCMVSDKDFSSAIKEVLNNWQIDIPLAEVLALWANITVFDDVIEVVKNLKTKGYRCCLATNQQSYRANIMRNVLDYDALFDYHFYSCEMGIKKPDCKYFEYIVSTLEVPASQLLFIDDKESNVNAAKQVGLQAFSFDASQHASQQASQQQEPSSKLLEQLQLYNISI